MRPSTEPPAERRYRRRPDDALRRTGRVLAAAAGLFQVRGTAARGDSSRHAGEPLATRFDTAHPPAGPIAGVVIAPACLSWGSSGRHSGPPLRAGRSNRYADRTSGPRSVSVAGERGPGHRIARRHQYGTARPPAWWSCLYGSGIATPTWLSLGTILMRQSGSTGVLRARRRAEGPRGPLSALDSTGSQLPMGPGQSTKGADASPTAMEPRIPVAR